MRRLLLTVLLLFSATVALTPGTAGAAPAPVGVYDWWTYHGARDRAGYAASMPAYKGGLRTTYKADLDGAVYAQPIIVAGLRIVATENNTVYALDSRMRTVWRHHIGAPSPASQRPCGNIDPLGITGTPVYSTVTGLVYVAAELSGNPPRHTLYGFDLRTGALRMSRGLDPSGVDQRVMQQRGALTIAGGRVWVPFGGLAGDCGNYKGRVIGFNLNGSGSGLVYTVPTPREAGIWTPPGPSVDAHGNLYVSVGNGAVGSSGGAYDYSDSVTEINPANGRRTAFFAPSTWRTDNDNDLDLGSQGPALVGSWVFIAGKSGRAYTVPASRLGGIGATGGTDLCRSFGGTAVVSNTVLVPCTDRIRRVAVNQRTGRMTSVWSYVGASGSPVVGGGVVWTVDPSRGLLLALRLTDGARLAAVSVGSVSRFATPAPSARSLLIGTNRGVTLVTY